MLLKFSLENWQSFKNLVSFSMVATEEQQHRARISRLPNYKLGILPIAALFGGNASGKTTLCRALGFVQYLITKGNQPDSLIPIDQFRLDSQDTAKATRFVIELIANETVYEFSFSVTMKEVIEEKLVQIFNDSEKVLYSRSSGDSNPHFDNSIKDDPSLEFAFKGTRDNQLFLTNSVHQKIDRFRPIYDWFKDNLELIAPDSRFNFFEQFIDENHSLYSKMNKLLAQLDTGITHLGGDVVPFSSLNLPEQYKMSLQENLKEGMSHRLFGLRESIIISRNNGELIAKRLVAFHLKSDGTEAKFEMQRESDGTQRIIDLLPAFLNISSTDSKKVIIIDEVDRSLHTLMIKQLLGIYLSSRTAESRSQLLFTTHNTQLMDRRIFRCDEMWVTERDAEGISSLWSLSEFREAQKDKNLQNTYLSGKLGGIPQFLIDESYFESDQEDKEIN